MDIAQHVTHKLARTNNVNAIKPAVGVSIPAPVLKSLAQKSIQMVKVNSIAMVS
jgi:hypothetical protein